MKLSKIFHFLYFAVLSIPLVTIPIFAIYSQNHEINDNSITINESYWENSIMFETDTPSSWNDLELNKIYHSDNLRIDNIESIGSEIYYLRFYYLESYSLNFNLNRYLDEVYVEDYNSNQNNFIGLDFVEDVIYLTISNNYAFSTYIIDGDQLWIEFSNCEFVIFGGLQDFEEFTQTYWTTNYITESTFKVYNHIYHENSPVVYDDTDIMSQFLYQEYNFMDKYLGIYKYQPFNGIYNWIGNTFFGGTSPIVFTIFYQWLVYWLFASLCWLIFDVLMYVPLLAHRWLDKAGLE